MKVIIICLSFTPTSQSRFCPRPVVRDSDTEHGPGDQGQFMGGNEHKSSFMEPPATEEVPGEVRSRRAAGPSRGPSRPSEAVQGCGEACWVL